MEEFPKCKMFDYRKKTACEKFLGQSINSCPDFMVRKDFTRQELGNTFTSLKTSETK